MMLVSMVQIEVIPIHIILIRMKQEGQNRTANPITKAASGEPPKESKSMAKKTGKHVTSTVVNAQEFMKQYQQTEQKNKEADWLHNRSNAFLQSHAPVKVEPKKDVPLPPFLLNNISKQQVKVQQPQKTVDVKEKHDDDGYKQSLNKARAQMMMMNKKEDKNEVVKPRQQAKTNQSIPPNNRPTTNVQTLPQTSVTSSKGQPLVPVASKPNTPLARLQQSFSPKIESNTNEFKPITTTVPVISQPNPSVSNYSNQSQGFRYDRAIHNPQSNISFPNIASISPINPIASMNPIIINQPQTNFSHSPPQQRREETAQSEFYSNPQWLNYRARLTQLLRSKKGVSDRVMDILAALTFPDPKYLDKELIENNYKQIIKFGLAYNNSKENKKDYLNKLQLCCTLNDKQKLGFDMEEYLKIVKAIEPKKELESPNLDFVQDEEKKQDMLYVHQTVEDINLSQFYEVYHDFITNFRDDLQDVSSRTVKLMRSRHKIDELLERMKEESSEQEQYEEMMDRFDRIHARQEVVADLLEKFTVGLRTDLPKNVLNYELEELETFQKEEEYLSAELHHWRAQLSQASYNQPYRQIINSFCECCLILGNRVQQIESSLSTLSSPISL